MALPTSGMTMHFDAFANSNCMKSINGGGSGIHTNPAANGEGFYIWEDELGSNLCLVRADAPEPKWNAASAPMAGGHVGFDGTNDHFNAYTQTFAAQRGWQEYYTWSGGGSGGYITYSMAFAFYIGSGDVTLGGLVFASHPIVGCTANDLMGVFLKDVSGTPTAQWVHLAFGASSLSVPVVANQVNVIVVSISTTGAMTMSVNGGTEVTATSSGTFYTDTHPGIVVVGRHMTNTSRFKGRLGQFVFWNRALDSTERAAVATELLSRWSLATSIKLFKIPTTAADGTARKLIVWPNTFTDGMPTGTPILYGANVMAAGGYFKFYSSLATVGANYPCMLSIWGEGLPSNVLFGGPCWAVGAEEFA